jgi:hypothetical protein
MKPSIWRGRRGTCTVFHRAGRLWLAVTLVPQGWILATPPAQVCSLWAVFVAEAGSKACEVDVFGDRRLGASAGDCTRSLLRCSRVPSRWWGPPQWFSHDLQSAPLQTNHKHELWLNTWLVWPADENETLETQAPLSLPDATKLLTKYSFEKPENGDSRIRSRQISPKDIIYQIRIQ